MKTYQVAGLLSGGAGLLTFLVMHHFWIMPIWFILPFGLVMAGLGGLAVGWSYGELLPHLPRRPWTSLAVFLLVTAILAPSIVLSVVRPPIFDMATSELLPEMSIPIVARRFITDLLVVSIVVGGLAGWAIGRSRRAVVATALAGFIFALGPGHNIPFFAGAPWAAVLKATTLLLAPALVSAIVLVETDALLPGREHEQLA
jgi:hypothetical protein